MKFIHDQYCGKKYGGTCRCVSSHGYTVQRELRQGDLVTFFDDFELMRMGEVLMKPRQVAKLEGFSNDGFNGISCTLTLEGGHRVSGVQAGWLLKSDEGRSRERLIQQELDRRIGAAAAALSHALDWAREHKVADATVIGRVEARTRR